MNQPFRRALVVAALTVAAANPGGTIARAAPPPPAEPVGPLAATVQSALCNTLVALPGIDVRRPTPAQRNLALAAAHRFSTGAGQVVAVIDTGVAPHPRLPRLRAGGDYVSTGDGLEDCDAHGTAIAGIIGGQSRPFDAFVGVAPGAAIIAIRQSSRAYKAADNNISAQAAFGNVTTLARAVVRAVNLGATVINVSEVACAPSVAALGDAPLERALAYAAQRNVVVVVAAGNAGDEGGCHQNPYAGVPVTMASPARFSDAVITVGSVESDGRASNFSLNGPWVAVAAPGTHAVSLDTRGGLASGQPTDRGIQPLAGTSFAAPYVAGLAALIRSRFPRLSAAQVKARIIATAHRPYDNRSSAIGFGMIDPVAALTATVPGERGDAPFDANRAGVLAVPPAPAEPSTKPRTWTLLSVAGMVVAGAATVAVLRAPRPRRRSAGSRT